MIFQLEMIFMKQKKYHKRILIIALEGEEKARSAMMGTD